MAAARYRFDTLPPRLLLRDIDAARFVEGAAFDSLSQRVIIVRCCLISRLAVLEIAGAAILRFVYFDC